jgi:hypothetical protein
MMSTHALARTPFILVAMCASSIACLAQPAQAPAAAVATVKAGLWETTTVIENATNTSRRSIVGQTCIVAADAANLARIVPPQREPGVQCENRDVKRDGASVVWTVSCKSADAVHAGKGRMSVFAESYLGSAEVDVRKQGAKPVKLRQSFSGKWLRACG